jgi:DNA-binding response OmpR family regulator
VLILTARREESDTVLGLETGADDYLTKPFGVREFVARVRALLRRPRRRRRADTASVHADGVRLDRARRLAWIDDAAVELTPHEFDVLFLLVSTPGIVHSREDLLARVWTTDTHVTERSVDSVIKRLRQKVERDSGEPTRILTVWGTGYKFTDA